MFTFKSEVSAGTVNVVSSANGPLSNEQWAQLAADKIIYVGNQTEGPIRDQAIAYKQKIAKIIEYYIAQAVQSNEKHLLQRKL